MTELAYRARRAWIAVAELQRGDLVRRLRPRVSLIFGLPWLPDLFALFWPGRPRDALDYDLVPRAAVGIVLQTGTTPEAEKGGT